METIAAKTILSRTKSTEWFGTEYNMNIYRGCCHGCIYCDSMSDCYRNVEFGKVKAKENALSILRDNLKSKVKSGVVATGSMSDPYNPYEESERLSRHALELLSAYGFGAAIATKSPLVTRDIDILSEMREHSPVIVKVTITTADEDVRRLIEPYAPSTDQRFEAVKKLSEAGVFCGVLLMPVLPYINDSRENLKEIVRKASECGAKFVYAWFGVTLRDSQRAYYYQKLDESFPGLREKYKSGYGDKYACECPNSKLLYYDFKKECDKLGLLYKMQDIISGYKMNYAQKQVSFFD